MDDTQQRPGATAGTTSTDARLRWIGGLTAVARARPSVSDIASDCEANLRIVAPEDLRVQRTDREHGMLVESTFTLDAESAAAARESALDLLRSAMIGAIRHLPEEARQVGWWLGARAPEDLIPLQSE